MDFALKLLYDLHFGSYQSTINPASLVYTSPVDSEEDRIARIVEAAVAIRQQLAFLSAHVSLCCVVFAGIAVGGRTFEHLL